MRLIAVGECTIDRYLETGAERAGGISLNFAINACRAGAEQVGLVSCTGTDDAATAVRRRLDATGIDATHLYSLPGKTASQKIHLAAEGERVFPPDGYDAGVLADFKLQQADIDYLRSADVVAVPFFRQIAHLCEPMLRDRTLGAMCVVDLLDGTDLGAVPSFNALPGVGAQRRPGDLDDPGGGGRAGAEAHAHADARSLHNLDGLLPFLEAFDILFISGNVGLAQRLLPWSRRTRSVLVVTHGAAGSSALLNGVRYVAPAEPVPVNERIDTTGCGDAFQAAFTVDYFRNRDVRSALHEGARRAAVVIRHLGATSDDT